MNNSVNKKKKALLLIFDLLLAAGLLFFDQYTKFLAVNVLKGQSSHVLIDGVLEFAYLENRGSAFGMLQNQKVLLVSVAVIFVSLIFYVLCKIPTQSKYNILHVILTFVVAGGIGNLIDRISYEYVIDFIYFSLIDFPIFNVADCYIVVGTIILFILFMFRYKEEDLEFLKLRRNKKETE